MFVELMTLIQRRPLTITVVAIDEKQIRVNVIPNQSDKDEAANKELGHRKNEVAAIPESAIAALTTPLSLTGTAAEIDAVLVKTLADFTATHVGLQNTFDTAAAAIQKAIADITECERIKKEQDKAKNKKPDAGKDEKKNTATQEPSLPSLFTAPSSTPAVVSANDTAKEG
jgi:PRTRC genetic system protein E